MSKLKELIAQLCPEGIEYKKIGEIATYRRGSFPQPYTNRSYYGGDESMPFVQVADIDEEKFLLKEETRQTISKIAQPKSVFVPKGTVISSIQGSIGKVAITQYDAYIDRTIAIFDSFKINIDKKFFAYCIQMKFGIEKEFARGSTLKTITKEEFTNFYIPVPPLEVQYEIVRILDKFTLHSLELTKKILSEIKARENQYLYYVNKLLKFNEDIKYDSMENICEVITDYVANGSFGEIAKNVSYKNSPDYAVLLRTADYSSGYNQDKFVYIDEHAYNYLKKSKLYGGEIIINNVGAGVGTTFLCPDLNIKMSLAPNTIMLRTKNNKFYYYWLNSKYGQDAIEKITSKSSMPKFNKTGFRTIIAPVPSIEEQERIVNILDRFNELHNNILQKSSLEIEKNNKQYEYYRNKLLSFKELKVEE